MLNTFSLPFSEDKRMIYAKEYLEGKGYICVDDNSNADFVLLPIPVKDYMFVGLDGKLVFYGMGDYKGRDYNKNESYLLANAYLTAEGAVALCKESSDIAIFGSKVLVTGYGRIAKALCRCLASMGADVTVCSRSESSRIEALFNNFSHIAFDELKTPNDFDFVFNTVPHIVFTKPELSALKEGAVIIDLASFPGGVDTLVASSKNIKLINGRGLPSRYSEKTAGYLVGKAVVEIIKGDFS